jgi:Zn-dependent metalloprotease
MGKTNLWVSVAIGTGLCIQAAFSGERVEPSGTSARFQRGVKLIVSDSANLVSKIAEIVNSEHHGKDSELRIKEVTEDARGTKRIKLQQFYKNIPVEGATIQRRVVAGDTLLDQQKGTFSENLAVDVIPRIDKAVASDVCLKHAINTTPCKLPYVGTRLLTDAEMQIQMGKKNSGVNEVGEPELVIAANRLAYKVVIEEDGIDFAKWVYFVEAQSGKIISVFDVLRNATAPSSNGAAAAVQGVKLLRESSSGANETVTMTGWRDAAGARNYFLAFPGSAATRVGQWAVYDNLTADYEQQSTFDWGTSDPFSISVAKNAEITENWMKNTLGVYGADNSGKGVLFYSHYPWVNRGGPWSDPKSLCVYLCDPYVEPAADGGHSWSETGGLDVIAHEFGHLVSSAYEGPGTVWHTNYTLIPGNTINEAMYESNSDIMATAVEFANQLDGSSAYPGSIAGRADWLLGEDFDNGFIDRDMRFPQRPTANKAEVREGRVSRVFGTGFYFFTYDPNFPVVVNESHKLAGIQNFAFYLLSQGSASAQNNDGLDYGVFPGVGIVVAARIAMNANMNNLKSACNFQDARIAWKQEAQSLVDQGIAPAFAPQTVEAAWSAVGVEPELRISQNGIPYAQAARTGDFMTAGGLYQETFGTGAFKITNTTTCTSVGLQGLNGTDPWSMVLPAGDKSVKSPDAANLDNSTWLQGKLIIKNPNGLVTTAIDDAGNLHVRKYCVSGTLML